ncbi:MAG: synthase subcomplex epsilon subunit [Acidobacteriales bacterium]|nr:synthase subcomplex epsilon subunit [Terriglobales bacterium]
MAETFQVEIVTPERKVVIDNATEMQIPGKGGYLGILPGHAPLITELAVGEIGYRDEKGQVKRLAVAWGFAEVLPTKVTILAEVAERAEEIDVARAQRTREAAEAALKANKPDTDAGALESEIQRASNRIAVAEKLNGQMANLVP